MLVEQYPQQTSQIQLEINITIGHQRYQIYIPKNTCIIGQINNFLTFHKLNIKYQKIILMMVYKELQKKQKRINNERQKDGFSKKNKQQVGYKKEYWGNQFEEMQNVRKNICELRDKEKKKANNRQDKYQTKHNWLIDRNQREQLKEQVKYEDSKENQGARQNLSRESDQKNENKSMDVYQKWKKKEKTKDTGKDKSKNKNLTPKSKINVQNQFLSKQKVLQAHEPEYFYNKGIGFQKAKQIHREQLFKKQYPFGPPQRQTVLTPSKKQQLHERLYKDSRVKEGQRVMRKAQEIEKQLSGITKIKNDKFKEKIAEKNDKIDNALQILLKNGLVDNPYKIRQVSKSPFRKTNLS